MKFTVITATYNNESSVAQTVKSVLEQSNTNIEHIIIDNCSNDKTLEIINKINSPFVKIFSEQDTGIYNAFNKGIAKSDGDIIAFLNSGDYYLSDTLNKVEDFFLENSNIDCIHGNIVVGSKVYKPFDRLYTFKKSRIFHPATFMRREIFDSLEKFNEKYEIASDLDLFIRAKKKFKFKYIDMPITSFELGGISTTNKFKTILEVKKILKDNNFHLAYYNFIFYSEILKYTISKILKSYKKK
jgi:glycosyltransferase involved in cell wall biosynthesis